MKTKKFSRAKLTKEIERIEANPARFAVAGYRQTESANALLSAQRSK